jgi:hypothetical protein
MENNENEKQGFSTRDLYQAASLVTLGFQITQTDFQIEGDRRLPVGYFQFEDTPELREALKKYRQGQLLVEPKQFSTNLRAIKAEVTNIYSSPHSNF